MLNKITTLIIFLTIIQFVGVEYGDKTCTIDVPRIDSGKCEFAAKDQTQCIEA